MRRALADAVNTGDLDVFREILAPDWHEEIVLMIAESDRVVLIARGTPGGRRDPEPAGSLDAPRPIPLCCGPSVRSIVRPWPTKP